MTVSMDSTRTPDLLTSDTLVLFQYELGCLSQLSYLVGDRTTGRALVVDPRRDIAEYLADAEREGLTIEWVFETHFHADFLSGHLELAEATGATIVFGQGPETEFPAHRAADGEVFSLGVVNVEVRSTPGHTPESVSLVVTDTSDSDTPVAVLTGDTLFIGDVGRPDLLASVGVTAEELASMLYDSLRQKLMTLPDQTMVLPAHGAGSACGKNLSTETVSTIGEQRASNYAVADMTREQFMDVVTEGQPSAPEYFVFNALLNRADRDLLEQHRPPAMTVDEVLAAEADGAAIIDTRDAIAFATGHLRNAVNVGLDGRFAEYVGSVVSPDTPIVLVSYPGTDGEARMRLGRIGFDKVIGYLADADEVLATRPELVERASRLTASDLDTRRAELGGDLQLVDIRNAGEVANGMLDDARHLPLAELNRRIGELDPAVPTVVYCAGGYRSSIAASLLRSKGFDDVSDLLGGYGACSVS
jgi:glyoxylase-like metal-dependent hydrolase (beta-lactamase superfamily II)/rhodanese-related sulfurtransferase